MSLHLTTQIFTYVLLYSLSLSLLAAAVTLSSRLLELSGQIQEFVHKIAENRQCALQSLDLQLHLGQLKVSKRAQDLCEGLGILEFPYLDFQDFVRHISEGIFRDVYTLF